MFCFAVSEYEYSKKKNVFMLLICSAKFLNDTKSFGSNGIVKVHTDIMQAWFVTAAVS